MNRTQRNRASWGGIVTDYDSGGRAHDGTMSANALKVSQFAPVQLRPANAAHAVILLMCSETARIIYRAS